MLAAAYLGFSALQIPQVNDKVLHSITFFLLTIAFYFILDTTRRRVLNLTLLVVTFFLALGSELIQGALPNGRNLDPLDIAANVGGSLAALGLCSVYHKRMLERKRRRKGYGVVPQEGEDDLELGGQEVGVANTHDDDEAWDDMGEESGEGDEGRPALNGGSGGEEENAKK